MATHSTDETVVANDVFPPRQIDIPCWANFSVSFPAGKDVSIKVSYTALGNGNYTVFENSPDESWSIGGDYPGQLADYRYVLQTGAGWYGSIGKADFVVRFPYAPNEKNVEYYSGPAGLWQTAGNELRWHRENFEPDGDISLWIVNPPVWQTVLSETGHTRANPQDGNAWGRLAEAYQQSIWDRRGLRSDPAGIEMYQLSDQDFSKAVSLLPADPDWHYRYAELLCWNAVWKHMGDTALSEPATLDWTACVRQLKMVYDINPHYPKLDLFLQEAARMSSLGVVDISGPKPDFLILTPQPTSSPAPTETVTPTTLEPSATMILQATSTNPAALTATLSNPQTTDVNSGSTSRPIPAVRIIDYGVIGLLVVVAAIGIGIFLKSKRHGL